jgi:DNA-3-methyladenine glycosylase
LILKLKITDYLRKLPIEFYNRKDVQLIARELLGNILVTRIDGKLTSGRIVETEAYIGITDRASHSFGGRRTQRNEDMYGAAGISYVYICYGMHNLFNVVTNQKGIPDAVLIRALDPLEGIDTMLERSGKKGLDYTLTKGPGNLSKALGINKYHSGKSLQSKEIYITSDEIRFTGHEIKASKRIGVESAGNDGLLPFRFYVKGNKYVSGSPK